MGALQATTKAGKNKSDRFKREAVGVLAGLLSDWLVDRPERTARTAIYFLGSYSSTRPSITHAWALWTLTAAV